MKIEFLSSKKVSTCFPQKKKKTFEIVSAVKFLSCLKLCLSCFDLYIVVLTTHTTCMQERNLKSTCILNWYLIRWKFLWWYLRISHLLYIITNLTLSKRSINNFWIPLLWILYADYVTFWLFSDLCKLWWGFRLLISFNEYHFSLHHPIFSPYKWFPWIRLAQVPFRNAYAAKNWIELNLLKSH